MKRGVSIRSTMAITQRAIEEFPMGRLSAFRLLRKKCIESIRQNSDFALITSITIIRGQPGDEGDLFVMEVAAIGLVL